MFCDFNRGILKINFNFYYSMLNNCLHKNLKKVKGEYYKIKERNRKRREIMNNTFSIICWKQKEKT